MDELIVRNATYLYKTIFLCLFIYIIVFLLVGAISPAYALLPANFEKIKVVGGLNNPTGFRFAPNGDIYIAEQCGAVKIFRSGSVLPTPVIQLSLDCTSERGLLGIELDPNFATNGYFYLSYTGSDEFARLSRFHVVGDVAAPASEFIIDKSNQLAQQFHNANDVHIGPDGKIWWLVGDNLDSSNSQSLYNIHGKVLRFDMDGTSANDNPWHGQAKIAQETYALGLRNPFRMTFLPNGKALVADVGSSLWEEMNIISSGGNYGWPLYEGDCGSCGFINPVFIYSHSGHSAAITALAVYNGSTFPSQYKGVLFYGDYAQGVIRYVTFDNNYVSVLTDNDFDSNAGTIVDMHQGPDGNIYYAGIYENSIWKIQPAAGDRAPIPQAAANPIVGLVPLNVSFSSAGTYDPDVGDTLTYSWNFADGSPPDTNSNPTHTYNNNGIYNVTLTVSDGTKSSQASVKVTVGNRLPSATIDTPVDGTKYNAGNTISYSGSASDPEDGTLANSAYSWKVIFHHQTHIHPFLGPIVGSKTGTFTVPIDNSQESDTWYEIQLTATDSGGLQTTISRSIYPNIANITINSNPNVTQFTVNGMLFTGSYTGGWVVGVHLGVAALSPEYIGIDKYRFQNWSDGGAQSHTIIVPASDTIYQVNFLKVQPVPAPWQEIDMDGTKIPGGVDYVSSDNSFIVDGAGWDIWAATDQFHMAYQPLNGNGEIVARVTSFSNTIDGWARAGVMIKESTTAQSPYALLAVTPGNGIAFQYNFNGSQGGSAYTFPNTWLKLTRAGNVFTAYTSTDGINWTLLGSQTIEMNANTLIGFFVNSHNGAKLATATFDNVTINDVVDPANTAPTALDQSIFTSQDATVSAQLKATDPDPGRLNYTLLSAPTNGTLNGSPPNVNYTPNLGYQGTDSFTFKANDGVVDSNTATVNITVKPPAIPVSTPWATLDLGAPVATGSATVSGDTYIVVGGGDDIWQTSDQFRYVYQPLSGDGDIMARVTTQENSDPWAKAGVMIKESTTALSPYAMMSITPGNGYAFQANFTSDVHGSPYVLPNGWVRIKRVGNTFTAYSSTDGLNWTQVGSKTVSMSNSALVGLFVTSHNGSLLSRVTFDNVSINGITNSPLPSPWLNFDVGLPEIAGSVSYLGGVFTVNGGGNDIWGTNDQFHYAYQAITGNAEIIARLDSQTNTDPWAKAGIMIKESITAFSPYAFVDVTPGNGVRFQYNFNGEVANAPYTLPAWLKLTRIGNSFSAYTSLDGVTWSPLGAAVDVAMSTNALVGLAVSSHNSTVLGTATFSNVTITGEPPDLINPTVSIDSPLNQAAVKGVVNITATASDNKAVTKVEFYIDNVLHTTDTSAPYGDTWNTSALVVGSAHTIYAKAYDQAGNSATSSTVNVTIADSIPPTTSITSPLNNTNVKGIINISANATDNIGVTNVEFYVDGTLIGGDNSAPYQISWNTTTVSGGVHTLTTKAYDAAANVGSSTAVSVTVDNTLPTVSITSPLNNTTVAINSNLTIIAKASDNIGVAKVEFYVSGALKCTDSSSPYFCVWKVPSAKGKTYQILAKAYDVAGNVASSTIVTVKTP